MVDLWVGVGLKTVKKVTATAPNLACCFGHEGSRNKHEEEGKVGWTLNSPGSEGRCAECTTVVNWWRKVPWLPWSVYHQNQKDVFKKEFVQGWW